MILHLETDAFYIFQETETGSMARRGPDHRPACEDGERDSVVDSVMSPDSRALLPDRKLSRVPCVRLRS